MAPLNPQETFDALMKQQRHVAAGDLAHEMTKKHPGLGRWWFAAGRAALARGRLQEAADKLDRAEKLLTNDADVQLQRAIVDHRLARSALAIQRLRALIASHPSNEVDATIVLAEVLHRANEKSQLDQLFSASGDDAPWKADPRAQLFVARIRAREDPAGAIFILDGIARSNAATPTRRIAGFEAIRLLDSSARYREAFDLAVFMHASTGTRHDTGGIEAEITAQARILARGGSIAIARARAPQVESTAIIVALPRSGTTLLEQMLDRHPSVTGIGEYEGIHSMSESAISKGLQSSEWGSVDLHDAQVWQQEYLLGAACLRRPTARWTLDKTLHAWRLLPLIAAVLPGAVMIAVDRDPRDTAISTFLGNFHPTAFGWSGSIESIQRVITAHRTLLPGALERLGFAHESVVYENLVADPSGHAQRCLTRMGLTMDATTLAPEHNPRTVLTLSHDQVRRPINRSSIGRWRNYAWAFDGAWDCLAESHAARVLHE